MANAATRFSPIDYTARDYNGFRNAMYADARLILPEWTQRSASDFGVMMVELLAARLDVLSFLGDRIANESFLQTAVMRSSVLNIARTLDYHPAPAGAATVVLTFTIAGDQGVITIPKCTQVQTVPAPSDDPVVFELDEDLVVGYEIQTVTITGGPTGGTFTLTFAGQTTAAIAYNATAAAVQAALETLSNIDVGNVEVSGTAGGPYAVTFKNMGDIAEMTVDGALLTGGIAPAVAVATTTPFSLVGVVAATQGELIENEDVGGSDGAPSQRFRLAQQPVVGGSLSVTVNEGVGAALWREVTSLLDEQGREAIYSLDIDEYGGTIVVFGDDVNGKIPAIGSRIVVSYRVGGGLVGNVAAETLTDLVNSVPGVLTVTNLLAATGGMDAEKLSDIRRNAPKSLRTLRRAVSLEDFASLASQVPGVARASSALGTLIGTERANVDVYVAPTGGGVVTETFRDIIDGYLNYGKMLGTTVDVLDPTYVGIDVTVDLAVKASYNNDRVTRAVELGVVKLLAFDNTDFGYRVTLSQIYSLINTTEGVDYGIITLLRKTGEGAGVADVQLDDDEIPDPTVGTITINAL